MSRFAEISGIGPALEDRLVENGITDIESLAAADPAVLAGIRGVTPARAESYQSQAREALGSLQPSGAAPVAGLAPSGPQPEPAAVAGAPTSVVEGKGDPAKPAKKKAKKGKAGKDGKGKESAKALKREVKKRESKVAKQLKKLKAARKALKKAT
jgi:hypothetical protein